MRTIEANKLVLDMELYPRQQINWPHVSAMKQALEAGADMPPLVVCKKSLKIVDGFHRYHAITGTNGDVAMLKVIEKEYASVKEMFLDAIKYNATHGAPLTIYDRRHCAELAAKYKYGDASVAAALGVTRKAYGSLKPNRNSAVLSTSTGISAPQDDEAVADTKQPDKRYRIADFAPKGEFAASIEKAKQRIIDAAVAFYRCEGNDAHWDEVMTELSDATKAYLQLTGIPEM